MKHLLLYSLIFLGFTTNGQNFIPPTGSSLTDGNVGTTYAGQSIIVNVPTTATVTGQQLLDAIPSAQAFVGSSIDPNEDYTVEIDSVTYYVQGLPAGMTTNCNGCTVTAGSSSNIIISGTPTTDGPFTVLIQSQTIGETDIDTTSAEVIIPFGGYFDPGIGFPIPIDPLESLINADYTMDITNTNNLPTISVATAASSNCNGSAEVMVYSGVPPFTYSFSTGQSGSQPTLDSLCTDVYNVSVEDGNGAVISTTFVIPFSSNVYSNAIGFNGDTLFGSPIILCDLDYNAPIDSFEVTQLVLGVTDTLFASWVVWQQGVPYLILGEYPNVNSSNLIVSLTLFCLNGRAELGSFQLFAEAPEITAGLYENTIDLGVELYPNPTTSTITLQTETPLSQAWLTDLTGRRLMPLQSNGTQWQANLSALPAGIYLIEAFTEDGTRAVKKVVRE